MTLAVWDTVYILKCPWCGEWLDAQSWEKQTRVSVEQALRLKWDDMWFQCPRCGGDSPLKSLELLLGTTPARLGNLNKPRRVRL